MHLRHVLPFSLLVACGGSGGSDTPATTLTEGDLTGDPTSATDTADPSDTTGTSDTADTEDGCTPADACRDDDDCDPGQTCLADCTCSVDAEDTDEPPVTADYGPCHACAAGEQPVKLREHEGCFCAPECAGERSPCPDPTESTAEPACAVWAAGDTPTHCALVCLVARNNCPEGAMCEFVQLDDDGVEVGFCTHPIP